MILSGKQIREQLISNNWKTNADIDKLVFGPNSVDVTITNKVKVYRNLGLEESFVNPMLTLLNATKGVVPSIDLTKSDLNIDEYLTEIDFDGVMDFSPNNLYLGSVNEYFDASNPVIIDGKEMYFVPMYEGRSTMARLGFQSHISAGFGDYGFKGSFTLEIINTNPNNLRIPVNSRVGQVYFISTDNGVLCNPYQGYDQTDCLPTSPRLGANRL